MNKPHPLIGHVTNVFLYNDAPEPCRVIAVHVFGTIDVERLSDGQCFRVSGLSLNVKELDR